MRALNLFSHGILIWKITSVLGLAAGELEMQCQKNTAFVQGFLKWHFYKPIFSRNQMGKAQKAVCRVLGETQNLWSCLGPHTLASSGQCRKCNANWVIKMSQFQFIPINTSCSPLQPCGQLCPEVGSIQKPLLCACIGVIL